MSICGIVNKSSTISNKSILHARNNVVILKLINNFINNITLEMSLIFKKKYFQNYY